jgi:hypothetical protein
MGLLWSYENWTGSVYYGVILGDPVEKDGDPLTFEWDDSAFPNGEILADGTVIVEAE